VLIGNDGMMLSSKTPSTPADYGDGVVPQFELLAGEMGVPVEVVAWRDRLYRARYTTSSLNALVMGNVPDVGFMTTKGHRDSIFIMNVEDAIWAGRSMSFRTSCGTRSRGISCIASWRAK